ncbi:MAG TPA: hypothetical protein PKD53_20055 [Chloroflexaceae bacterium]|nr:hypothetical protein [Chloroflexaceae bacterium]
MSDPKLTPGQAERIINFLRDNPGVSLTLIDLSDALKIPVEDLAAYLEDLSREGQPLVHELTPDGVDVYFYPSELQRGESSL